MAAFTEPAGRQPRGLLKINGELLDGWTDIAADNNGFFSADTFSATLIASRLPSDRDLAWFSQQQDMFVELFFGFPQDPNNVQPSDLQSWIYGQVDDLQINLASGTIQLAGRDLTRMFIDTKTTEKWPNQTSSQIVTQIGRSHGLTVQAEPTMTRAGKFYEIDNVNLQAERSEWDLLNYLANVENFSLYVRGQTLFFQPKTDPSVTVPYEILWDSTGPSANFEDVTFARALTVSRGIQVIVRSWNKRQAKGFVATYPSKVKTIQPGKSSVGTGVQIYSKTVPNLTQEQATQYAQNWYQQLIQHEMRFSNLVLPGNNDLDITSVIKVSGTGTAFDQLYFPDEIHRSLSFDGGYSMIVSAKNHATDSEVGSL